MNPLHTPALFIGATGQNVGKTTICLGLMAVLQQHIGKVGFVKPVGQQHTRIDENTIVDKDVALFKEHFSLPTPYEIMSPVIIPSGFTRKILDDQTDADVLEHRILTSYRSMQRHHDFVLVEGTGHLGVGSIVFLNNARIALLLGLEVVIIASAGLGSAFDELTLNIVLCQAYGVKVRGVILNRVRDEKRDMILHYFPKALDRWGIPLLGCIPYHADLTTLAMRDFETLFRTSLLAGEPYHHRYFRTLRLVAGSLEAYWDEQEPNELIITPASREDIILATLERQKRLSDKKGIDAAGGMILTGRHPPSDSILRDIRSAEVPTLYAPLCSYEAMKQITSFIGKIRVEDTEKIHQAKTLVEQHLDFSQLLSQTFEKTHP